MNYFSILYSQDCLQSKQSWLDTIKFLSQTTPPPHTLIMERMLRQWHSNHLKCIWVLPLFHSYFLAFYSLSTWLHEKFSSNFSREFYIHFVLFILVWEHYEKSSSQERKLYCQLQSMRDSWTQPPTHLVLFVLSCLFSRLSVCSLDSVSVLSTQCTWIPKHFHLHPLFLIFFLVNLLFV